MAHYFSPGAPSARQHRHVEASTHSSNWSTRGPSSSTHVDDMVEQRPLARVSLLSPVVARQVSHDVVRMLDAELAMRDAMRHDDQLRLEALQSAIDACQEALQRREKELEEIERSLQERIAQETLNVHYEFEERIQSRDATIDEQHSTIGRLEALLASSRSHLVERGCQVGDAATVTPGEREQLLEQRDLQKQQYEALLSTERSTLSMQRQHWDELFQAKLQMERDAALGAVEKERQRWMGELKRMEVAQQAAERKVDEGEAQLAELRKMHETAEQGWASEREQATRASESMAMVRKQMEMRLQDVMEQHKLERSELQTEFDRAIKAHASMHEQTVEEERDHRQRVEEELRLLRADRNRAIGDHRAEVKALEAKLVATQLELTKQLDRCSALEDSYAVAQRALSDRDREVKEKCLKWEEMAVEATKQRAAAQLRVSALEEKLAVANLEAKKALEVASATGAHKLEAALHKQREEVTDALGQQHQHALEAQKADHAQCLRAVEEQWKASMTRVKELEDLLQQQSRDKSALEATLSDTRRTLSTAEAALQRERAEHAMAVQQQQLGRNADDKETLSLREQIMKMNHTVWSLQSQLHQSQQDVSFLEATVERMRGREQSPRGVPVQQQDAAATGASPLRPDEKSEVEALFSYFHR